MTKNQNIELLRVISAFGIVWFHSKAPGEAIAYAGLIAFFILSMYLAGTSQNAANRSVQVRARRLLLPWAVWFLFYGLLNRAGHHPFFPLSGGVILGILAGSVAHLWFMPFIFFCLLGLDLARRYLRPASMAWGSASIALAILAATPWWRAPSLQLAVPLPQYAHAIAGAFIGVFFAYRSALPVPSARTLLLLLLAAACAAIPYPGVGIAYLLGIVVSYALIFRADAPARFDISAISNCTFGIYFVHVLFISVALKFFNLPRLLLPVAVFCAALLFVFTLRKLAPRLASYWG